MVENLHPGMTVSQVLGRWPRAATTFLRHRMACVGCAMAPFDALEEIAAAYRVELAGLMAELKCDIEGAEAAHEQE